jgi:hypothetical protein
MLHKFTVIGVYVNGDADEHGERFADYVLAKTSTQAEKKVWKERGDRILIAGTIAGHVVLER